MEVCGEDCPIRNFRTPYTVDSLQSDQEKSQPHHKASTTHTLPIWNQRLRPTQIQLLCIQPGDICMPIITSLSIAKMTFYDGVQLEDTRESITYEALSYSWGAPTETMSVQCNKYDISVRTTLYNALLHLRLKDSSRCIWVDALCINQDDNEEKSVQVSRMSSVYYKADKVVAYLGKQSDCSDAALQLLADMDPNKTHTDLCHQGPKHFILSVQLLLKAPWFTRTWVRQEVFMANSLDVQTGFVSLDWGKFVSNVTALLQQGRSIFPAPEARLLIKIPVSLHLLHQGDAEDKANVVLQAVHGSGCRGRDLDVVLRGSQHFEATDPRDFVYGVASMTTAGFNHTSSPFQPSRLEEASIDIDY